MEKAADSLRENGNTAGARYDPDMAAVVGSIVLSIMLPVFSMYTAML